MTDESFDRLDCIVVMENMKTGEVRCQHVIEYVSPGGEWDNEYLWSEGNYSCDCNRAIFFFNSNQVERECGGDVYRVLALADVATGKVLYSDD